MLASNLLLLVILGQAPDEQTDPAALAAQLGSGRYAEREAASESLLRLGRTALPVLREARSSRDMEVRNRAYNLIQRIEGALLTEPSRVRLDFDNASLSEIARSLSQQTGFKVVLNPENLPKWKSQRVTLRQPDPIPFWKAVDRLCDAAQLQYNLASNGLVGPREPTFPLNDGTLRTITPNSDHGPFRVSLVSVDYERHVNYGIPGAGFGAGAGFGPGPGFRPQVGNPPPLRRPQVMPPPRLYPITNSQFSAHLMVAAEPRLSLSQVGTLQVLEAVDNRDNSLILSGNAAPTIHRMPGYFGMMNGSVLQLQAQLQRPAMAGETIKKLRGIIPLTVSSRRPDPLIVPLDQGTGKRYENPDVELTVHDIRTQPNSRQTIIELSLKSNERGTTSAEHGDGDIFRDVYPDSQRLQLEILDSRGQVVPWSPFPSGDSESSHVTLTVMNLSASAPLKELRYHTLTRATVSIPFEFHDIPMP